MRSAPDAGTAGVGSSGHSGEVLKHPHPVGSAARGSHVGHADPWASQHAQFCRLQKRVAAPLDGTSTRTRVTARSGCRTMDRMITNRITFVSLPAGRGPSRENRAHRNEMYVSGTVALDSID